MTARDFTLSLAHATLLHVAPPDLVRIGSATGYDYVGLRLIPIGPGGAPGPSLAEAPGMLRETRRALAETGVRVLDVEVFQIRDDRDARSYLPALDAAAELGARFVLTNVYTADPVAAAERFAALCDLARPLGLNVALEFVSFSELPGLAGALAMVRQSGRENASVLVDTLHFHSSGAPVSDLGRLPSDLVYYVHLCDAPGEVPASADDRRRIAREGRLLPGEGGIDLAGILRHLPRGIVYAVEVQSPARARAMGAQAFARLAFERALGVLAIRDQRA
jgi:sugar phosphate isomerase/epimerase